MANESPASILFDRDGYDLAIAHGDSITADQPGFLAIGKDGSTARIITLDSSGRSVVVGAGSAGSPAGGLITIQGDAAGTPLPTSIASLPLPSGAATEATLATRLAESTFTARINTLGQKTMANSTPVVLSSDQSTLPISAASLPLPSGAATETTLLTLLTASTFTTRINTLGQKTMANSTPVVISSDQSTITITGAVTVTGTVTSNQGTPAALANAWPIKISDGSNYAPLTNAAPVGNEQGLVVRNIPSGTQVISGTVTATVSGTVTANQGTPASLSNPWPVQLSNGTNTPIITNTTPGGSDQALVVRNIPSGTQAISAASLPLPTGAATEATLATRLAESTFTTRINTLGQKTMANSMPVVIASDQTTLAITGSVSATQSGTWTVQPGNTANTTPWLTTISQGGNAATVTGANALKVDGSSVTQPVSGTVTANIGTSGSLALDASIIAQSLIDNNAFTDGVTRVQPVGYIFDEVAGTTLTENDAAAARIDSKRAQIQVIEDGTTRGTRATVKAASTAPVSGDTSLVVVLSPNQPPILVTTSPSSSTPLLAFGDIALAAITTVALRRTTYTEQSVNFTGSIVSSSANDSSAGTGARTVRIYWMNQAGATTGFEDVTLNGVTPVNLVTSTKCFIEAIEVLTVGSTRSNAGIITLKTGAAGAGTTVGTIGATDNITFWAHHYVKSGLTCNVTGILIGSNVTNSSGSCIGSLRSQVLPVADQVDKQVSDGITVAGLDSSVYRSYGSQIQVAGPARITLIVTTATGSAFNYRGSFDAYES